MVRVVHTSLRDCVMMSNGIESSSKTLWVMRNCSLSVSAGLGMSSCSNIHCVSDSEVLLLSISQASSCMPPRRCLGWASSSWKVEALAVLRNLCALPCFLLRRQAFLRQQPLAEACKTV
eukprot:1293923-Amphidinium_carterae.3